MDDSTRKTCGKCQEAKPLSEFHRDRLQADGRVSRCKVCIAEYKREYLERNRDAERERKRAWYEANREHMREKNRRYREENRDELAKKKAAYYRANRERKAQYDREYLAEHRDRIRSRTKAYYEANREKHRERGVVWKLANADKVRELGRLHSQNRRAQMLGATIGEVDLDALWDEQGGLCGLCGEPIDREVRWPDRMSASIDHIIPLSRGGAHAQFNLQWTHLGENSAKGARLLD